MRLTIKFKLIFSILFFVFFLISCANDKNDKINTLRIGFQKEGTLLALKEFKLLENRFKKDNIAVEWKEFPSGPPMLEALSTGNIDFAYTGETPPIFSQAAKSDIVYVAKASNSPKSEAIITSQNSNIKTIKDLKGKNIAVAKGSSAHYTLIGAILDTDLKLSEVNIIYLQPFDARVAFINKKVDAWSIWDPYLSSAVIELNAKLLATSEQLGLKKQGYYLTSRRFIKNHLNIIKTILSNIKIIDEKINSNPKEFAKLLTDATKLPREVVDLSLEHWNYNVSPISNEDINYQQNIANTLFEQKIIPIKINIRDAVLDLNNL